MHAPNNRINSLASSLGEKHVGSLRSAQYYSLRIFARYAGRYALWRVRQLIKAISFIFAIGVSFGAGYLYSVWNFVYSDTYELQENIQLVANGEEQGVLPKGAELHYQSAAHNEVDFYVFVRLPQDKAMAITKKVKVDTYNGVKRLRGGFE